MSPTDGKLQTIAVLKEIARTIASLESDARQRIDHGDEAGYRDLMRQKALILAGLPETISASLEDTGNRFNKQVLHQAQRFSKSANMALELDSVFFMYALLYPEDYQEGEENDLEAFIGELEAGL